MRLSTKLVALSIIRANIYCFTAAKWLFSCVLSFMLGCFTSGNLCLFSRSYLIISLLFFFQTVQGCYCSQAVDMWKLRDLPGVTVLFASMINMQCTSCSLVGCSNWWTWSSFIEALPQWINTSLLVGGVCINKELTARPISMFLLWT